jgi:DNA-binding HxlR family transcriptional regulator
MTNSHPRRCEKRGKVCLTRFGKGEQVQEQCEKALAAVRDTLYVLGGKWKLPIIMALSEGPLRFKELHRALEGITPKILSKELKELELNHFATRTVYATSPVSVEYELTEYSRSLDKVIFELRDWGLQHRKRLKDCYKARQAAAQTPKTTSR